MQSMEESCDRLVDIAVIDNGTYRLFMYAVSVVPENVF